MVSTFLLPILVFVPVPGLLAPLSASAMFVAVPGLSAYFLIFYRSCKLLKMT